MRWQAGFLGHWTKLLWTSSYRAPYKMQCIQIYGIFGSFETLNTGMIRRIENETLSKLCNNAKMRINHVVKQCGAGGISNSTYFIKLMKKSRMKRQGSLNLIKKPINYLWDARCSCKNIISWCHSHENEIIRDDQRARYCVKISVKGNDWQWCIREHEKLNTWTVALGLRRTAWTDMIVMSIGL